MWGPGGTGRPNRAAYDASGCGGASSGRKQSKCFRMRETLRRACAELRPVIYNILRRGSLGPVSRSSRLPQSPSAPLLPCPSGARGGRQKDVQRAEKMTSRNGGLPGRARVGVSYGRVLSHILCSPSPWRPCGPPGGLGPARVACFAERFGRPDGPRLTQRVAGPCALATAIRRSSESQAPHTPARGRRAHARLRRPPAAIRCAAAGSALDGRGGAGRAGGFSRRAECARCSPLRARPGGARAAEGPGRESEAVRAEVSHGALAGLADRGEAGVDGRLVAPLACRRPAGGARGASGDPARVLSPMRDGEQAGGRGGKQAGANTRASERVLVGVDGGEGGGEEGKSVMREEKG